MTRAPEMPIEEQRALAASMFPQLWERASHVTGKRGSRMRAALRKDAIAETIMAPIRENGGACANCDLRLTNPAGMKGLFCGHHSGGGSYQTTRPESLCPIYEGPAKPREAAIARALGSEGA